MSRFWCASRQPGRKKVARDTSSFAALCFASWMLLVSGPIHAAPTLRIGVAPFAAEQGIGANRGLAAAQALATQLSNYDVERLLAPGDFVAASVYEPRASEVRRWAYNGAVDTIIVGRVVPKSGSETGRPRVVETILRSGHSGAELSRHDVVVLADGDLERSMGVLAKAILVDLGHVEPVTEDQQKVAPVVVGSGNADPAEAPDGGDESSGGDFGVALSKSEFRNDAPIEIKADEAEIINRDQGRRLIFQRNVWVRKDNVTLRSDRLEAAYQKGESEPRELIAEGNVQIVQNDRRAKCDRAVYLREANRLTCSGRAELVQGCDIIRGASIEFDLAGERARVEGAASIVIQPKKEEKENEPTTCTTTRGQM